jgi:hypothetical protein
LTRSGAKPQSTNPCGSTGDPPFELICLSISNGVHFSSAEADRGQPPNRRLGRCAGKNLHAGFVWLGLIRRRVLHKGHLIWFFSNMASTWLWDCEAEAVIVFAHYYCF